MWLNLGRLLMLCLWAVMLSNVFHPFPRPTNVLMNIALIFTLFMHGLQLLLMHLSLAGQQGRLAWSTKVKIFVFGSMALLTKQKD